MNEFFTATFEHDLNINFEAVTNTTGKPFTITGFRVAVDPETTLTVGARLHGTITEIITNEETA